MNEFGRIKIEIEDTQGKRTFFADVNGRGIGKVVVGEGGLKLAGFVLKVEAGKLAGLTIDTLPTMPGGLQEHP